MIGILLRRFDRTGKGEVRFDDFIQLCVIVRVSLLFISPIFYFFDCANQIFDSFIFQEKFEDIINFFFQVDPT